jgi:nucleotide-binding universal stress UspA family protein
MILQKIKIKKIMYTTDLSRNSLHAFSYAVSLANQYHAGITILHVLEQEPNMENFITGYISTSKWEAIKQRHEDDAKAVLIGKARGAALVGDVLDQFCKEGLAEMKFDVDEILIRRGKPVEQILAQAVEKEIDLIVMGTHGSGTLADVMLGSTARRVLRRSTVPVFVVRLPEA